MMNAVIHGVTKGYPSLPHQRATIFYDLIDPIPGRNFYKGPGVERRRQTVEFNVIESSPEAYQGESEGDRKRRAVPGGQDNAPRPRLIPVEGADKHTDEWGDPLMLGAIVFGSKSQGTQQRVAPVKFPDDFLHLLDHYLPRTTRYGMGGAQTAWRPVQYLRATPWGWTGNCPHLAEGRTTSFAGADNNQEGTGTCDVGVA
jgi:hypothetical protein